MTFLLQILVIGFMVLPLSPQSKFSYQNFMVSTISYKGTYYELLQRENFSCSQFFIYISVRFPSQIKMYSVLLFFISIYLCMMLKTILLICTEFDITADIRLIFFISLETKKCFYRTENSFSSGYSTYCYSFSGMLFAVFFFFLKKKNYPNSK